MIIIGEKLQTEKLLGTYLQKIFHHKITVTLNDQILFVTASKGGWEVHKHCTEGVAARQIQRQIFDYPCELYRSQVSAPRCKEQDKHSHYKPVQLELTRVM